MNKKKYTIDRLEEGIAVCIDESGNVINIPLADIPEGSAECDSLTEEDGKFILKKADCAEIRNKFDRMFKK